MVKNYFKMQGNYSKKKASSKAKTLRAGQNKYIYAKPYIKNAISTANFKSIEFKLIRQRNMK